MVAELENTMSKKSEIIRVRVTDELKKLLRQSADSHLRDEADEVRAILEVHFGLRDPGPLGYPHITVHKPPDGQGAHKNRLSRG